MGNYKDLISMRRSCRIFTGECINADDARLIIRAGLMSPTSMGRRSWQFIVVDDKTLIEKIADAKDYGSQFLKFSPLAVVILGDPIENDCWVEDCSIAAFSMQLQAADLGLGSCWAQMRGRGLTDGTSADVVISGVLGIPDNLKVLCVIGFGQKDEEKDPHNEDELKWENVHINCF